MTSLSLLRPNGTTAYRNRNDPFSLARELFSLDTPEFKPAFDVKETEDAFLIEADLPGVKEGDLEITFDRGRMTIAGTRNAEKKEEGENYHLYERRYGSFSRTFNLPRATDPDSVAAKLDAGVLRVSIPKKAAAKARKIPIK